MEKPIRPQRNRRHSRRPWLSEDELITGRANKRLFTPEIKRMLKEWLVRRRDNPYPSREEKKCLAIETGLTYTQICNWFANWRRKLKNSECAPAKQSWGHLIKNYNTNAKGNVEQFSISSEDSIWREDEKVRRPNKRFKDPNDYSNDGQSNSSYLECSGESNENMCSQTNQSYSQINKPQLKLNETQRSCSIINEQYCHQSSQSHDNNMNITNDSRYISNNTKYKQKIMEKYLKDKKKEKLSAIETVNESNCTLSKWLESAANFTPNKNNYCFEWKQRCNTTERKTNFKSYQYKSLTARSTCVERSLILEAIHHKDEIDAAEALANLARNSRQRLLNSTYPVFTQINTIRS